MNIQKLVAQIVGGALAIVGIVGFFAGASLLGFGLNSLHNLIHLLTGLLGLAAGFYADGQWAKFHNRWMGVVYAVVTVFGFSLPGVADSLLAVNLADNVLHLGLAIVLMSTGFGEQYIFA